MTTAWACATLGYALLVYLTAGAMYAKAAASFTGQETDEDMRVYRYMSWLLAAVPPMVLFAPILTRGYAFGWKMPGTR